MLFSASFRPDVKWAGDPECLPLQGSGKKPKEKKKDPSEEAS